LPADGGLAGRRVGLAAGRAAPYIQPEGSASKRLGYYDMAMQAEDIERLIRARFPQAQVTITDLAGDGNHYAAEVIDESFRGMNRVQQQRAVYAALQGKMDGPAGDLHALALTTKAPD
jgi:stress-induced morphogen